MSSSEGTGWGIWSTVSNAASRAKAIARDVVVDGGTEVRDILRDAVALDSSPGDAEVYDALFPEAGVSEATLDVDTKQNADESYISVGDMARNDVRQSTGSTGWVGTAVFVDDEPNEGGRVISHDSELVISLKTQVSALQNELEAQVADHGRAISTIQSEYSAVIATERKKTEEAESSYKSERDNRLQLQEEFESRIDAETEQNSTELKAALDRAEALQQQMNLLRERVVQIQSEHSTELDRLKGGDNDDLIAELSEMKRKSVDEIEQARCEHQAELDAMKEQYEGEISRMKQKSSTEIDSMKRSLTEQYERELEQQQIDISQRLSNEHVSEMKMLADGHERDIESLKAEHQTELDRDKAWIESLKQSQSDDQGRLMSEIESLKAELVSMSGQHEAAIEKERASLKQVLADTEANHQSELEQAKSQSDDQGRLMSEIESLKAELVSMSGQHEAELHNAIERERAEVTSMKQALEASHQSQSDDQGRLMSELEQSKNDQGRLMSEIESLKAELVSMSGRHETELNSLTAAHEQALADTHEKHKAELTESQQIHVSEAVNKMQAIHQTQVEVYSSQITESKAMLQQVLDWLNTGVTAPSSLKDVPIDGMGDVWDQLKTRLCDAGQVPELRRQLAQLRGETRTLQIAIKSAEKVGATSTKEQDILRETLGNQTREVDRLRSHLVELETEHTNEITELEAQIAEFMDKAVSAEAYQVATDTKLTDECSRMATEIQRLEQELVDKTTELDTATVSLSNLQVALDGIEDVSHSDSSVELRRTLRELAKLQEKNSEMEAELSGLKSEAASVQVSIDDANEARAALIEAKEQLGKQETDTKRLKRALEQSVSTLTFRDDDHIDRRIILKLLMTYLDPGSDQSEHICQVKKRDALGTLAGILGFSEEDRDRAGLGSIVKEEKSIVSWLNPLSWVQTDEKRVKRRNLEPSLSDMWIEFLLKEVDANEHQEEET